MDIFGWILCGVGIIDLLSVIMLWRISKHNKKQNYYTDGDTEIRYNNEERYGGCQ